MDTQNSNHLCQLDSREFLRAHHFKLSDHYHFIRRWLEKRKMVLWPKEELPQFGYVASYHFEPVAMGFIRKCERGIGLFDSLICDPDCEFEIRNECLDFLVKTILFEAKRHDFKKIIAYSINISTLERSKKHGFHVQPHQVISQIL